MAHYLSRADNKITELQEWCWNKRVCKPTYTEHSNGDVAVKIGIKTCIGTGLRAKHAAAEQMLQELEFLATQVSCAQLLNLLGVMPRYTSLCKDPRGHVYELQQAQGILRDVKFEFSTEHDGRKKGTLKCQKRSNTIWIDVMAFGYGRCTKEAKFDASKTFLRIFE